MTEKEVNDIQQKVEDKIKVLKDKKVSLEKIFEEILHIPVTDVKNLINCEKKVC